MNQDASQSPLHSTPQGGGDCTVPKRRSIWTKKERVIRLLWGTLGKALWILFPPLRSTILRLFGATIGKRCCLPRYLDIAIPWNIYLGDDVSVADHAILYSLGPIVIGNNTVIDSKAHLCAGTHDMTDPLFPLLRPPITVGSNCFIGFDAYIGPDTTLADRTIVHPRSSIYRSTESNTVWKGNPAKLVDFEQEQDVVS